MGTERVPHHLLYWVRRCRESLVTGNREEAESCLERISTSLGYEDAQVAEAFRRFDVDNSGQLDGKEFLYMCAYIGWGAAEARLMDVDSDGSVTREEFRHFVGNMGGLQQLFEHRRQRVARKQWGVDAPALIEVGCRVRAYSRSEDGKKSPSCREAQVLELHVMPSNGVLLDFGFDQSAQSEVTKSAQNRQVVPQSWIYSDAQDSDVVSALQEVGILQEQQGFWASIFPQSELRAALANVRANAAMNHDAALPEVRQRFAKFGYSEKELQAVLGWIQDLAPMVVHIHIDKMGRFLETDEYYRSQFETGTSCGALGDANKTRKGWEKELFGGTYDDCKPFERPKYGALGVMNDYRGVTSAYQYGDSYLVLKDVRLRTTFASTDSGGIKGSRLAVLDKYAHVLKEYSDNEIKALVDVALANTSLADTPKVQPQLLRGMCADCTAEWVTTGFPDLAQKKGRFFFEVHLLKGCASPQAGLLSSKFVKAPRTQGFAVGGVGDDEHGWAADGQHAMLWHAGNKIPWNKCWESSSDKKLSEDVVLGIAVDIDARRIWFASNGTWDEKPAFAEDSIPFGEALYPAFSVHGRASFHFGPDFKYEAPSIDGPSFARWPGTSEGATRVDCETIGDEKNIRIYKEIQVHGELSLKRNVQRLVANKKHLEISKHQRTWSIRIDGMPADDTRGQTNGVYNRTGARHGMPVYTSTGGSSCIVCSPAKDKWHIVKVTAGKCTSGHSLEETLAEGPIQEGLEACSPSRLGWTEPPEALGVLPVEIFLQVLQEAGVSQEDGAKLLDALRGSNSQGEELVFRVSNFATLEDQWDKLPTQPIGAEAVWELGVAEGQKRLLAEMGLPQAHVIESEHPYAAHSHTWSRTVCVEDGQQIDVNFSSSCCTLDRRTTLKIFGGGLNKSLAGVGARVHLKALTGNEQAHGTMLGKVAGGTWKVRIDSDEAQGCHKNTKNTMVVSLVLFRFVGCCSLQGCVFVGLQSVFGSLVRKKCAVASKPGSMVQRVKLLAHQFQ
ncbi:unnamed protein product [Polarella glacialis]|uniref:Calmodulin n=1 Tax=Polarella glacialis TaxID=89957 RepID=A0A813IY29_POLGL|nr:unnamed protein product [Polarella glacialis]